MPEETSTSYKTRFIHSGASSRRVDIFNKFPAIVEEWSANVSRNILAALSQASNIALGMPMSVGQSLRACCILSTFINAINYIGFSLPDVCVPWFFRTQFKKTWMLCSLLHIFEGPFWGHLAYLSLSSRDGPIIWSILHWLPMGIH